MRVWHEDQGSQGYNMKESNFLEDTGQDQTGLLISRDAIGCVGK